MALIFFMMTGLMGVYLAWISPAVLGGTVIADIAMGKGLAKDR